ncbi:GAF and ANTAR domain-containing protein [Nocardioides koreensis]|uniref:GAF and ANTAR domain-containing protein n=1 Tax=Nocardioides koreensis TaxID=433651 RepID=UPI0031D14BF2
MTTSDEPRDVWWLIADEPVSEDDQPHLGGWMQRLCRAAVRELDATGVGISIVAPRGTTTVLAASGSVSEAVEQLQFTLGEGPCLDALALGRPVLTPDLAHAARTRWPGYAPAVQEHGVRAVFSFPLQLGAARLGAMDVYRDRAGSMSSPALGQAAAFAEAAMARLLDAQEQSDLENPAFGGALDGQFELYQAQGMVQAQLGVSLHEAMARLRAYAYAHERPLGEVAADVVARRLVLEPDR